MRTLLHRFDRGIIRKIQKLPSWIRIIMVFASNAGHPYATIAIGVILVGLQVNDSVTGAGILVLLAILLSSLLKIVLRRARPVTYKTRSLIVTFSFPSGHTVGATVAYGTFALLAFSAYDGLLSVVMGSSMVLLIVLVGLSRVYLGAHYPSDVVAGWLLGGGVLAVILYAVQPAV